LNALLDATTQGRVGAGTAPGSRRRNLQGAGFASIEAIIDAVAASRDPKDTGWRSREEIQLTTAHVLWTFDDVLERYGAPTVVGAGERNLLLRYGRGTVPGAARAIQFTIVDSLVTWVSFQGFE